LENSSVLQRRKIYSVTELSADIKRILEQQYPMVWISGEISNLRVPASGHAYFTLKDHKAQIAAVMFRGQLAQLRFELAAGTTVLGLGRLSVYEPRGTYQIILEYIEPMGIGALQLAFERLKQALLEEGLFAAEHKTALPFLPTRVGVITSSSGAVLQDILNIAYRRFPNLSIDIYPVRVQGSEAAGEIVAALELANRLGRNEVLILARGGGSLEDLAPFNSERVARAIFSSRIPVVSAVGHETDYTIADFTADFRAPTPSAAAEIVIPLKDELLSRCLELKVRGHRATHLVLSRLKDRVARSDHMLVHPGKKIQEVQFHLDQLVGRLRRVLASCARQGRAVYDKAHTALIHNSPLGSISLYKPKVEVYTTNILQSINIIIFKNTQRLKTAEALLQAVNPAAVLQRGYSITRTLPQKKVVTDAGSLTSGQPLEIQLARGHVQVQVQEKPISTLKKKQ
jgi:exodeoxyribonuclease VII large subunit